MKETQILNKATQRQKPPAYRQRGGDRDEKGAMIRQTIVKNHSRTTSVAGVERDKERRIEGERRRYDEGNQRQNPPAGRHRGRGPRRKGENQPTRNGKVAQPTVPRGGESA